MAKVVDVCTRGKISSQEAVRNKSGAVLGTGAFGQITLHREGKHAWALKKLSHAVLRHRQLETALDVERQALQLTQGLPFRCAVLLARRVLAENDLDI